MKTFNVKMYLNRVDPSKLVGIVAYAIAYNLKHGIKLVITTEDVNVTGYASSEFAQVRTGINYCILVGSEKLFPIDETQDISIFVFDQNEWKTPPGSPYPLRSDTPTSDTILFNGKPYINLGIYTPQLNNAEITLIHELMHAYGRMAVSAGFDFEDCMDLMTVNGVPEPYYLNDQPDNVNSNFINQWERLYPWLNSLGAFSPTVETMNTTSKIDLWCKGAIEMEGADPSLNNPGNIRYVIGTWMQKLAIGEKNGFCVFKDYQTGYNILKEMFTNDATGKSTIYHPTDTLYQYYAKYAPKSDGNNPTHYAEVVAGVIGVPPTTQISTLV